MLAELYLTDGSKKINLLGGNYPGKFSGFTLRKMGLSRPQRSPSGIFRQTYGAVNETYDLMIRGYTADEVAAYQQELDRWLEQAQNFFESSVEQNLIWLVARVLNESNYRYAVVYSGVVETYGDVYGQPFMGTRIYTLNEITLGLERSTWLGNPPYEPSCVPIHNIVSWNPNATTITNVRTLASVQSMYLTASNYVLGGGHQIHRSIDSGGSWTTELTTGVTNLRFWKFERDSSGRIWAVAGMSTLTVVSQCGIYYSDDQGDNWTQHTNTVDFYNVVYRSRDNTLFFGGDGEIRYIRNGGALTVLSTSPTGKCKAMAIDAEGNIVIGDDYNVWRIPGSELSLYTATIRYIHSADTTGLYLVALSTEEHFLMGNASNIMISKDGGITWDIFWRDWGVDTIYQLDNGMMLASRSGNTSVYQSSDQGLSWTTYITASAQPTRAILELGDTYLFLGSLDSIYQRAATDAEYLYGPLDYGCTTLAYVANHNLEAQWTHILVNDSSAGTFTTYTPADVNTMVENQTDALAFPSPVGTSDAFYVGIATNVLNAGPFTSLYIELTDVNYTLTLAVEYYNGSAWTALTNGTTMLDGTQSLKRSGTVALTLSYASVMASVAINSITAWWIRFRVTATGSLSTQLPKFRNVYLIQKPYIEFDNIRGDIPALAQMELAIESHAISSNTYPFAEDIIAGLRSVSRGDRFTSIINFARIQNPLGISLSLGSGAAWIADTVKAAAGEAIQMTSSGSSLYQPIAYIQFDSEMANHFAGIYQVYIRLARTSGGSSLGENCRLRLSVSSFSDNSVIDPGIKTEDILIPTGPVYSGTARYAETYYMGQITLKPDRYLSIDDQSHRSQIIVECHFIPAVGNYVMTLYDIMLIPADEWIGHFVPTDWGGALLMYDSILDVDSAKFPKRVLRSVLRKRGTGRVNSSWTANASGAFVLSPGDSQRLWISHLNNHSNVLSCKLNHNPRWLALRGND